MWLLNILSTYDPDDEVFSKSFVPPTRLSKLSDIRSIEVPDAFLKDLPPSKQKARRRGLKLFSAGSLQQRIIRLKRVRRELDNRIIIEEQKKVDQEEGLKLIKTPSSLHKFSSPGVKARMSQQDR